jgi:phosphoserine phosphatase
MTFCSPFLKGELRMKREVTLRTYLVILAISAFILTSVVITFAQTDPLPSWNSGAAKQSIIDFVRVTTDQSSPKFVPPEQRIATFDQDGTLWVEHPMYSQLMFALDQVGVLAPKHPEWKTTEPFKSVLTGDRAAMAKFTMKDLEAIVFATHTGMSVADFQATVKDWTTKAKDPRWKKPFTDLVYQPMLEVMQFLRANGYRTYIVTGGGQEFVRTYAEQVYGVPPEQVIGSALETQYTYDKQGNGLLMRSPKLLLNNNLSGKPEDIYLFIGRRPAAAFGNTSGDQQMLEYAQAGQGASLMMLVLHDDATREYAYGPATGLPNSKVGTFSQSLYDEAKKSGWVVISMKNDWKQIFAFGE